MVFILFLPMPGISSSFSILLSNIFIVSSPKNSTIFFAVTFPIPSMTPLAKYFSMPLVVVGIISCMLSILNCLPNLG